MPNYYNPYQFQYYPQSNPMPLTNTQQIQNGGFVSVRNELEARNYPIAPGNSVTFKDETAPYVYTKTMGFSQLDRPIFEKYKLVKEDTTDNIEMPKSEVLDTKVVEQLKSEITALWNEITVLKENKENKETKNDGVQPTYGNVPTV